jgi:hypothetical protein
MIERAMPDGFDPHVQLQKIYDTRELILACRQRTGRALEVIDDFLDDADIPKIEKVKVAFQLMDRGHGKPRQVVTVIDDSPQRTQRLAILPDNGRDDLPPMTIEASADA